MSPASQPHETLQFKPPLEPLFPTKMFLKHTVLYICLILKLRTSSALPLVSPYPVYIFVSICLCPNHAYEVIEYLSDPVCKYFLGLFKQNLPFLMSSSVSMEMLQWDYPLIICLFPNPMGHGTLEFQEDFTNLAAPNMASIHIVYPSRNVECVLSQEIKPPTQQCLKLLRKFFPNLDGKSVASYCVLVSFSIQALFCCW